MNVRRLLALATPLLVVAIGTPAYTFFAPENSARLGGSPGRDTPDTKPYILKRGSGPEQAALSGMAGSLEKAGVRTLLNGTGGRTGEWNGTCGGAANVPVGAEVFCFDSQDTDDREWHPRGVTGVSGGRDDTGRPPMISWHDRDGKAPHQSTRVTFVDTEDGTYRHVLLVWPSQNGRGRTTYKPIGTNGSGTGVHAGGLAWYGDRLYVADGGAGLRVFDTRRIFDLGRSQNGTTARPRRVGLHGDTYYGHGHRYVMPQVASYVPAARSGAACTGKGVPRHSWLSIDRTGEHRLVTGERCEGYGRVARFPLAGNGDLVADAQGRTAPSLVARLPVPYVQGGTASNGTWWFTRNVPKEKNPSLPGQGELIQARWKDHFEEVKRQTIAYGPADLTCRRGTHQLWTVAERPGQRALYGMKRPEC